MLEQAVHRVGVEGRNGHRVAFRVGVQEVIEERPDVFATLPQRRDVDVNHVQPVEEVLTKQTLGDACPELPVGRADHAHVHRRGEVGRPDLLHLASLEEPEQQGLHPQRHLSDFVEQHRSLVGRLQQARLVAIGAGEAAPDVSEELGFEQ